MRISPDSFLRIAPAVHDDCIEIAGELVPITPENALKIKQAVLAWLGRHRAPRAELAKAQAGQDAALRGLLSYSLTKLKRLGRDLDRVLAKCPGGFLWGGRPRPQPDPLAGLGLVPNPSRKGASGAVQVDCPISVNLGTLAPDCAGTWPV